MPDRTAITLEELGANAAYRKRGARNAAAVRREALEANPTARASAN
jgi:hypothetical protein